ncbi:MULTISPECIES: carboxylating nicotinate-nucleotide diphosphorylase [unclassified Roseitalea]|uniref:carboxylating nicotinate-nucleotide diphosphorylase n=1 Tax=unclassified Roseitalea TaxID=2639107 RepID=UPI00273F161C|nr:MULTISPECIES: carboxylating nicotinate-nucleotide diphosphorylase [unclassified Roseitalea]
MTNPFPPSLPALMVERAVRAALREDLGRAGDITTAATIAPDATARAVLASRQAGVLAGLPMAQAAFALIGGVMRFEARRADGDRLVPGAVIAEVSGNARALLSAERVALNYLMMLSGIASHTARFAEAIAHTPARVCDTRKTVPGQRTFAKYAVRCGGGANHRYGLDDAVLIKDNHIAVCGGVAEAVRAARAHVGHMVRIEIEVDTLDQMRAALPAGPDAVLLDNMDVDTLRQAVAINRADNGRRVMLEASGNVTLKTVAAIARTGVDYISTSQITMAAPTLDIGLDVVVD